MFSDKKVEKIYTSARKQMLISLLPPVLTLHLKRFHQVSLLQLELLYGLDDLLLFKCLCV